MVRLMTEDQVAERIPLIRADRGIIHDVLTLIAEEREACAKIAETAAMGPIPILSASEARGSGHGASFMRDKIAAAIRART
jgi:hypothetical protein